MTSPVDTLKALAAEIRKQAETDGCATDWRLRDYARRIDAAIAALSGGEAPVAWMRRTAVYRRHDAMTGEPTGRREGERIITERQVYADDTPLYTTPRAVGDGWPSGVLARDKTLEVLRSHNDWRRGGKGPQTDPRLLGLALDAVIAHIAAPPE